MMVCPFCGSEDIKTSLDNDGAQCWCMTCSRMWLPTEEDLDRLEERENRQD